jgi:uncharacterized protein with HEPN domain
MSKKNYKSAEVYLKRMLEHILKIEVYKKDLTYETFKLQEQDYDAICMQLSQLGENVSKIEKSSDRIVENFPKAINWKTLKGLRNRIDHDYTWLEAEAIWEMLENNISDLKIGVKEILKKRYGL